MDVVITSDLTYCLASWGQTNRSTLHPLATLYKKTIKATVHITTIFKKKTQSTELGRHNQMQVAM